MYHELAVANFLDTLSKHRRKDILEAVYDTGLSWEEVLTVDELNHLRKLHDIESQDKPSDT